ncbi:putative receptor protein kinase ZmPK1 [Hordeum vulgare]|nr:putative receptor protein kinase ZmPK1 [Hordeum vulgare]
MVTVQRTELMLHGDADVDTVEDMERVERFTRVALWCIDPNPLLRPTMHQVVKTLETADPAQLQALPHHPPDCCMESSPLIPQLKMAYCSSNWSELSKEGKTRKKQKMIEHHQDVVAGGGGLAGGAGRDSGQHGQVRRCDRGAPISSKRVRIFFDGTGSVAATPVVG